MIRFISVLVIGVLLSFGPVLPSRGQWVEAPATGWVELQGAYQNTDARFDENADREPLFNEDAQSITTTVRLTGAVGIWRGLDAWVNVPVHHLQFDDVTRERTSAGIGDPRVHLRVGPSVAGIDQLPFAVAVRGGTKFPLGDFEVDAEVIPLSEGQRDWEVLLEVGKSLYPWPVYVMAWGGYRWRTVNPENGRKPGNERLFYAAAGGSWRQLRWKVALDGFFGNRTQFSGLALSSSKRELVQVIPTVGWTVGPGTVEAGVRVPFHGRNLPAGPIFTLGYFFTWDHPFGK